MPKKESFETKIKQLEEIVSTLEAGDLTLEQSIDLYEKGCRIRAQLDKILEEGEKRIRMLNEENEEVPLDAEEEQ